MHLENNFREENPCGFCYFICKGIQFTKDAQEKVLIPIIYKQNSLYF